MVSRPHAEFAGDRNYLAGETGNSPRLEDTEEKTDAEEKIVTDEITWRCFHCDEVFTDRLAAAEHFGVDPEAPPVCKIAAVDHGLMRAFREAEHKVEEFLGILHRESSDTERAYRSMRSRYETVIEAAEQKGYEKGLADHLFQLIAITTAVGGKIVVENQHFEEAGGLTLVRYGQEDPRAEIYEVERKQ
jgi:hypothetical protein